jgi:hypothetical protein
LNGLPIVLLVVLVFLVLRARLVDEAPGGGGYYVVPGAGNPALGPGVLVDPNTGARGGPSTRTQIETGVGSIVGAGAGLYICSGAAPCAAAGAFVGGTVAPYVSRGVEEGAKGVATGAEWAWGNTLGRLF